MEILEKLARACLALTFLLGICYLLSNHRRQINWRLVGAGIGLQIILAVLVLHVPGMRGLFQAMAVFFVKLVSFSDQGAAFLFGDLVQDEETFGFLFAFRVLPTIIFFSAFSSILYYLGVLQRVVYGMAWVMKRTMRLSGAESLAAAANVFIGQTEAPLLIKPYLPKMTRSEVLSLMTGGMATIAGGVLIAYIGLLGGGDPAQQVLFARHFLTASLLSAPAALAVAKILVPETEAYDQRLLVPRDRIGSNIVDAATTGTTDGVRLAVNVGAVLLTFTALIALLNYLFVGGVGTWFGLNGWAADFSGGIHDGFSFSFVLGLVGAPIAWLIGIPAPDILIVGQLLAERTVLNEFVAYLSLAQLLGEDSFVDPRSVIIVTYALCGFANLTSMGIQIGGIGAIAPEQRPTLVAMAWRSLLGGTVACFMTAALISIFV